MVLPRSFNAFCVWDFVVCDIVSLRPAPLPVLNRYGGKHEDRFLYYLLHLIHALERAWLHTRTGKSSPENSSRRLERFHLPQHYSWVAGDCFTVDNVDLLLGYPIESEAKTAWLDAIAISSHRCQSATRREFELDLAA